MRLVASVRIETATPIVNSPYQHLILDPSYLIGDFLLAVGRAIGTGMWRLP